MMAKNYAVTELQPINGIIILMPQWCANTLERSQPSTSRSTLNNLSFDSQKYFLGRLCNRQHDYCETGKTLRRISTRTCLECERENSRAYRRKHPERSNKSSSDWKKRNPNLVKLTQKRHRESGRLAANMRRWRQNHPEYKEVHAKKERIRRFKKRASRTIDYTQSQIDQRIADFNNCCAYCGSSEKLCIDHFIPLSKDGSDCIGNMIPACISCNSSKQNSDPLIWYKQQPSYSERKWKKILQVLGKDDYRQLPLF